MQLVNHAGFEFDFISVSKLLLLLNVSGMPFVEAGYLSRLLYRCKL